MLLDARDAGAQSDLGDPVGIPPAPGRRVRGGPQDAGRGKVSVVERIGSGGRGDRDRVLPRCRIGVAGGLVHEKRRAGERCGRRSVAPVDGDRPIDADEKIRSEVAGKQLDVDLGLPARRGVRRADLQLSVGRDVAFCVRERPVPALRGQTGVGREVRHGAQGRELRSRERGRDLAVVVVEVDVAPRDRLHVDRDGRVGRPGRRGVDAVPADGERLDRRLRHGGARVDLDRSRGDVDRDPGAANRYDRVAHALSTTLKLFAGIRLHMNSPS